MRLNFGLPTCTTDSESFDSMNGLRPRFGQVDQLLAVDHLAGGGVGGIEQRRFGGDVDLLGHLAEFEREIDRDGGLRRDHDALALGSLEARRLGERPCKWRA